VVREAPGLADQDFRADLLVVVVLPVLGKIICIYFVFYFYIYYLRYSVD